MFFLFNTKRLINLIVENKIAVFLELKQCASLKIVLNLHL